MTLRGWLAALLMLVPGVSLAGEPLLGGKTSPLHLETPHPYLSGDSSGPVVWSHVLHHPGATYLTVYLEHIELAPGDHLAVIDSTGKEQARFTGTGPGDRGKAWTPVVDGEVLVLRLHAYGEGAPHERFGLVAGQYAHGFLPLIGSDPGSTIDETCGTDNRRDVKCYEQSHPVEYGKARPVGRMLINGVTFCTGWLVSCDGHMLTNNHCVSSESGVENTQIRMLYQRSACGGGTSSWDRVLHGKDLIRTNATLDYTLFTVVEDATEYGYLGLDPRLPDAGERMYLPAHHSGQVKRFGIESDNEPEGVCRITESPFSGGTNNVSYFCDTSGGSSGSPVLSGLTHRVVALHHTASNNCWTGNHGVRMDLIYPEIQGDLPACSFTPDLLLQAVELLDGTGNGNGHADPGETLRLRLTLENRGTTPATGVVGTLACDDPGVLLQDDTASFPDIPDGSSGASLDPHVELRFSRAMACGARIPLELAVATDQGAFAFDLMLEVGENVGGARLYAATDVPLAIPDNDPTGVTSSLEVPDSFSIVDTFAHPVISHTYVGDLTVDLTSPGATTVRLHGMTGWSRDGLDDDYDRQVLPDGPGAMADFDGETTLGTWTLEVTDGGFFDIGNLEDWTLELHMADDFVCDSVGGPPTPGETSPPTGLMMVTGYDEGSGEVTVAYTPACQATDHAAFSGPLGNGGSFQGWDGADCGLGTGDSTAFDPGGGSRYFVLVGQDGAAEGSYGRDSTGAERPEATGIGPCDLPRNLFDACE